ncbi:GNAT family N-acetyltransferase [uncultured Arthrobacter sp.]|uniref:GNAT family N-acetyltransferase n=1 Tax=uncultured Arthrobacter sp. TaxID=114050 RepID=UPI0026247F52|nr:GNAT family N-acetyltransferase [uncultured Arthrobacter sp.]
MNEREVRRAEAEDALGIAKVHVQAWQEAYAHLAPPEALAALNIERRAQRWGDIIREGRTAVWVALYGGEIVGWMSVGHGRDDGPRPTELEGLYVLASHHGTGIGQRLMEAGIGTEPAYLWIAADNPRARAFYERNSFVPDGESGTHEIVGTPVEIVRLVR